MSDNLSGLDLVHSYIDAGLWVLPVKPNRKDPYTSLAHHGHLSATDNHRVLDKWINTDPDMNIGIACEMSQLVVLDFDFRSMGDEAHSYHSHIAEHYYEQTMCVSTGNGYHYYFHCPADLNLKGKVMDGIDIKYRGYVVAPPSMHPDGQIYKSNNVEICDVPDLLLLELSK